MNDLKKYKYCLIALGVIAVTIFVLFKQIQPKVLAIINLSEQVKTQTESAKSIEEQLSIAKQKAERKSKLRLLDDMTKKIYQPNGLATDAESTFAVLLDDIIEITRKNHIKTHSIQTTLDPEEDVFIKGDREHYSANRLNMKIISDYADFKSFLEDLYKYPYLVNINSFEIYPYSKNKRILLINLSITLYSSKSEEEAKAAEESEHKENSGEQQEGNPEEQPEGQ